MAFLHDFYAMSMANIQPFKLWHLCTVEIEIAIAIGVEFLSFSSISVPIPIWIPRAAFIIRIAELVPNGDGHPRKNMAYF